MKKWVSIAVLLAAAAAAAQQSACAKGTTTIESSGDGGDGGSSSGSAGSCPPCDVNATCQPGTGKGVCVCKPGYTGNGVMCADVDECSADPGVCGAGGACMNTPGGYSCVCAPGFEDANGACEDVDECAVDNGGCAEGCSCKNLEGVPPSCDCVLTQSLSQDIVTGSSVSCNDGAAHTDNSYYRVFDLAALGVDGDLKLSEVEVGIESATSSLGTQPAEVNLYQLNGAFTVANLSPISSTSVDIDDTVAVVLPFSVSALVPASSKLVVELFTPAGAGNLLYVGSNNLGETAPTYIRAVGCMIDEPMTAASIGFPDMSFVLNVHGSYMKAP